jgi:formate hydrogenlyase subunit 6/NADH:ubiquinone oxidoreductase subunit I
MENRIIEKRNMDLFVGKLINSETEVVGAKRKDNRYVFGKLADASQLCLDYDLALYPPKAYLLPPRETLIKFELGEEPRVEPFVEAKPVILFGVHPYDIKAIELLDAAFSGSNLDINYLSRREKAIIVGIDCLNPNSHAFCASLGTAITDTGFDLMLTDIDTSYVVCIGSSKGEGLLKNYAVTRDATQLELTQRDEARQRGLGRYKVTLDVSVAEVPQLLDRSWDSPVFKEKSEKCFSCGSCVMVCPTCFCFDVQDDLALDLKRGERYRQWDGCMLVDFALVAGGENFRKDRETRFRHRMYRKQKYLWERYGKLGCVGCGRCSTACLADIADPADTINRLKAESLRKEESK